MKYNLHHKPKNSIETLAIGADAAISQLDPTTQNYYGHAVAININKLIKCQYSSSNMKHRRKWNVIKKIKQKLNDNSLMIAKADKGKSIVILPIDTYKAKIHYFIQNNQFINLQNNPTDQYQKTIKHEIKKQNIIKKKNTDGNTAI
jgi:hypothetical protein